MLEQSFFTAISLELAWAGVRLKGWVDLHGRLFPVRVLLFSYNQPSSVILYRLTVVLGRCGSHSAIIWMNVAERTVLNVYRAHSVTHHHFHQPNRHHLANHFPTPTQLADR